MSSSLNAQLVGALPARHPIRATEIPERLRPAKGLLLGIVVAVGFWASAGAVAAALLH